MGAFLLVGVVAVLLIALIVGLLSGVIGGIVGGTMRTNITSRTFSVQGVPSVVITNTAGNVHVTTGSASTVFVQVTKRVRAGDDASARRGFDSIVVNITQRGDSITVSSAFASGLGAIISSRSVDYAITLPAGSHVQADVSAGNIDIADTTGVLMLTASAGNITASGVTFGSGSTLETSAGNLTANGALAPGGSLQLRVSAGNATLGLPASTAMRLDASVSVGNLTIIGFPVPVTALGYTGHHASGGVGAEPRGSVSVTVSTGNLTIAAH